MWFVVVAVVAASAFYYFERQSDIGLVELVEITVDAFAEAQPSVGTDLGTCAVHAADSIYPVDRVVLCTTAVVPEAVRSNSVQVSWYWHLEED